MPKPERGEIWLVRFPFTDFTSEKVRPVLVWVTHGEDVIVIGIFSRAPASAILRETWVEISEHTTTFSQTGLKRPSFIKTEKIAVVHETILLKKVGSLPAEIMEKVARSLKTALLIV